MQREVKKETTNLYIGGGKDGVGGGRKGVTGVSSPKAASKKKEDGERDEYNTNDEKGDGSADTKWEGADFLGSLSSGKKPLAGAGGPSPLGSLERKPLPGIISKVGSFSVVLSSSSNNDNLHPIPLALAFKSYSEHFAIKLWNACFIVVIIIWRK